LRRSLSTVAEGKRSATLGATRAHLSSEVRYLPEGCRAGHLPSEVGKNLPLKGGGEGENSIKCSLLRYI
ncbi:MAG: hypothetical protein ACPGWR_16960, partial [Ardenticatenaceae bacterium]